ncbi:MAG: helix-turn-helix domain-containing protein, partial [Cutibacterium sp.]|uniref:helix-turn-helix transcriptional regulator n=1 Tax=Cutibacterium sp. TaxID=1912221 RepID=UPI00258A1A8B
MKNSTDTEVAVAGRDIVGEHEQETVDSPTRDRVMSSILHNGPSTASELADRLGLTAAAVRRHLSALVSQGLVDSREKKVFGARGRGRPSRVFFLTDHGRADYYTAYDDLAISALRQLADAAGPSALDAVAKARVDDIESRYRALRQARPDEVPAQLL